MNILIFIYIMSRIYTELCSKNEFINNIKKLTKISSKLMFIKKYHKYEQYLDFIPQVLQNIIMSYINDIIIIDYDIKFYKELNVVSIQLLSDMIINYKNINFYKILFMDYSNNMPRIGNRQIRLFNEYNNYMKKYYNHNNYFKVECVKPTFSFSNHREFKYRIILIKKIHSCIHKSIQINNYN